MNIKEMIQKEVELVIEDLDQATFNNKEKFIEKRISDFASENCFEIVSELSTSRVHDLSNSNSNIGNYVDVHDLVSDLAAKLMVKEVLKSYKKRKCLEEIILQAQAGIEEIEKADNALDKFQGETDDIMQVFDRLQGIMTLIEKGNLIEDGSIFRRTPKTLDEIEKL